MLLLTLALAQSASAADLVRVVRLKISAGDLATGISAVEDYKATSGVDAEYLDAVGWLARGAELLRRPELARRFVSELHRELPAEKAGFLVPYGAAIEVEGRLLASTDGRGAAIRYFQSELARANATSLRSRIQKNIHLLSLEGQPAPEIESLAALRGKPVLLFFWAEGCGDCKAQARSLMSVWRKYKPLGLQMIAATRLYDDPPRDDEKARIEKFWNETFPDLDGVPVVVNTDAMVRYGVSATPTFALVDRAGVVRLYAPTRMSEADLSRVIDEVLR